MGRSRWRGGGTSTRIAMSWSMMSSLRVNGNARSIDSASDFLDVKTARARLPEWRSSSERIFLLTRDLDQMARLGGEGGFAGEAVNLGGIYHAEGRNQVLPYLYLSEADRGRISSLLSEGVKVEAQDLPSSPVHDGANLVDA